uniref:Ion_trans_2 domain-containing protein n=1 Tax=Macrostomum lignano TaxID=282301 RepID=A0A1I8JM32_9PLAT
SSGARLYEAAVAAHSAHGIYRAPGTSASPAAKRIVSSSSRVFTKRALPKGAPAALTSSKPTIQPPHSGCSISSSKILTVHPVPASHAEQGGAAKARIFLNIFIPAYGKAAPVPSRSAARVPDRRRLRPAPAHSPAVIRTASCGSRPDGERQRGCGVRDAPPRTPAGPQQPGTAADQLVSHLFVNRSEALWIIQVTVAMFSLTETLLVTYLGYKGNIWHNILSPSFLLELINTSPFILTIFSSRLRCLFVPVFLNCWLAKKQLEQMFADLNRVFQRTSSALAQRLMTVTATTLCIIFTSVCGIQHLQRGGERHFTLFDSFWFVMVTFSTVGYGDLTPDVWPSQLFMILMICVAITVLPSQVEKLVVTWIERKAMARNTWLCARLPLHSDNHIMDFLNEFYAHPKLQDYYVILFSPCELDSTLKIIMQRVIYIQGSALKDSEFGQVPDQHTIMRAWAVNDFAPQCRSTCRSTRPENKIHVKFAEYVVCEDEFKYAILANNCLCPGISTLVTLLLHTSRGQ